jgi:hypothetical protein
MAGLFTREQMEAIQGSKLTSYEKTKALEEEAAKAAILKDAKDSGLTPEQAAQAVADSGIGSVTPNLDRWAASSKSSTAQSRDLGTFKTYGDKSAFEAKNAVRKLQGLDPIAEPLPADKEFLVNLEKSASFGAESALVGDKAPKGQARAFEAGIRAGYTPEETRKLIADTAARITGVVDQQAQDEQAQKEKEKFVSDFANAGKDGTAPNRPSGMMTPLERTSAALDQSFFGALASKKPRDVSDFVSAGTDGKLPEPPVGLQTPLERTTNNLDKAFFDAAPTAKADRPKPPSSIGSTASVSFGELPYNEKTSDAEKYRRLIAEGYTSKQAFQMIGVKPNETPDWLRGTGVGNILESINAPE